MGWPFSSESAMATPLPRPRRRNSGRIGYCRRPRARGACIRRDRPDRPASRGPNQRRDRHHRRLEGAILQGEQDPSRCGQGVDVRTARIRFRRHTAREANALGRGNREGAHRAICLRAGEVDRPVGHLGARAGLINTANHRWCRAHHGKNNSRTISTFSGLAEIAAHTSNTVAVHHVDDSRAFADPGTVERCRQSLQGRRSFVRPANQKTTHFPTPQGHSNTDEWSIIDLRSGRRLGRHKTRGVTPGFTGMAVRGGVEDGRPVVDVLGASLSRPGAMADRA